MKKYGSPEQINQNMGPSCHLKKIYKEFGKTAQGIAIAEAIGLDPMREACPHFNRWLNELEAQAKRVRDDFFHSLDSLSRFKDISCPAAYFLTITNFAKSKAAAFLTKSGIHSQVSFYKSTHDMWVLQEPLGHASIQTMQIYVHTDAEQRRRAYQSFPLATGV